MSVGCFILGNLLCSIASGFPVMIAIGVLSLSIAVDGWFRGVLRWYARLGWENLDQLVDFATGIQGDSSYDVSAFEVRHRAELDKAERELAEHGIQVGWGARISDMIGTGALLRIDEVHHKVTLFPSEKAGIQHVNFQVAEFRE